MVIEGKNNIYFKLVKIFKTMIFNYNFKMKFHKMIYQYIMNKGII